MNIPKPSPELLTRILSSLPQRQPKFGRFWIKLLIPASVLGALLFSIGTIGQTPEKIAELDDEFFASLDLVDTYGDELDELSLDLDLFSEESIIEPL